MERNFVIQYKGDFGIVTTNQLETDFYTVEVSDKDNRFQVVLKPKKVFELVAFYVESEYEFMPEGRFATAKIRINGGEWESVLFGEKTTILANDGINTIDVKVYSGNRNLFGPHHHISGESWSAGAGAFTFSRLWKDNAECKYFAHGKTFFVPFGLDKLTVNKLK